MGTQGGGKEGGVKTKIVKSQDLWVLWETENDWCTFRRRITVKRVKNSKVLLYSTANIQDAIITPRHLKNLIAWAERKAA